MPLTIQQIIQNAALGNGIPPALALAQAQQESSLNPNAYNPKSGATGLFQLIPSTAAMLGVTDSTDPAQNSQGGTSYLAQLYAQFGSWDGALAAFDWGPTNVANAQLKYGPDWLNHAPTETQNYVATILSNSGIDAAAPDDAATAEAVYQATMPGYAAADDSGGGSVSVDYTQIFLLTGLGLGAYVLADLLAD